MTIDDREIKMNLEQRIHSTLSEIREYLIELIHNFVAFIILSIGLIFKFSKLCLECVLFIILCVIKKLKEFKQFFKRNTKKTIFISIKLLCFVILALSGLSLTLDYLSYPYIYKLIVSDNKNGFDLPAISVCTERNVFFDKHKVIQYFDLQQKYEEFENISHRELQNNWRNCLAKFSKLSQKPKTKE